MGHRRRQGRGRDGKGLIVMRGLPSISRVERFGVPTLINAAHQPLTHLRLMTQGSIEVPDGRALAAFAER